MMRKRWGCCCCCCTTRASPGPCASRSGTGCRQKPCSVDKPRSSRGHVHVCWSVLVYYHLDCIVDGLHRCSRRRPRTAKTTWGLRPTRASIGSHTCEDVYNVAWDTRRTWMRIRLLISIFLPRARVPCTRSPHARGPPRGIIPRQLQRQRSMTIASISPVHQTSARFRV